MAKENKLYLVMVEYRDDNIDMGYLPFMQIPPDSILWKALKDPERSGFSFGSAGINGIHYDLDLAEEHLKLEQAWRKNSELKLRIIDWDEDDVKA